MSSMSKRSSSQGRAEAKTKQKTDTSTSGSGARKAIDVAIEKTDNLKDAKRLQRKLDILKQKVDAKVKQFEEADKKARLNFRGKGAVKCAGSYCSNSFNPDDSFFCGFCTNCSNNDDNEVPNFCEECLVSCECGEMMWCYDCKHQCKCCEEAILCKDCESSVKCEHCHELVCDDCTREVGNYRYTLVWCIECEEQTRSRW